MDRTRVRGSRQLMVFFKRRVHQLVKSSFCSSRWFHRSTTRNAEFSHAVIGGGIVGVAIGSELQSTNGNNVLLLEKNASLGEETTSRNSEVIHAGIYYPRDTLKGSLCIRGKNKIYNAERSGQFQVPLKQCGKLVVAQSEQEQEYLEKLYKHSCDMDVPVEMLSKKEVAASSPLIQANSAALHSPSTGIISAHDYLLYFQTVLENEGGTIGLNTEVIDINFNSNIPEYRLVLRESSSKEEFEITADNVINAAGLYAQKISNLILPEERHMKSYFAKGTYFSYSPEIPMSSGKITSKLIYPCPNPNASSLGTHLTLDLGGQLKFGPDLEWLNITDADDIDYSPSPKNIGEAYKAIRTYFPSIRENDLQPSYTGVRPKLVSAEENKARFQDFMIREEEGFPGFVNLMGIESPGLTASWAIADYVKDLYHK
ncbi:Piso0_000134 [Millerozyma farinosa CBS 7064]|uniref:L-2-hydroxyglutarate dehydrogenase, mitochondrial n=1 Tax=Pichia sorbitophila (strain ATCC MYA-4447 / BCRC 22081 / CBS 7064 / NBRC 10061 / NRRL Y-12695) TaxID=559304 RepID=G8YT64_PICSO|nr:Piso0_000134 [Millerozyma farinosa CBS 7064]